MSNETFVNDGPEIAEALLDHLNTWGDKPSEIKLEAFDKDPISMMMQQLSGAVVKKKYINGSYIGAYPFAVYIRTEGYDTAGKLDAAKHLNHLNEWLQTSPFPSLGKGRNITKIEMTSLPSMAARYEDGTEDYQAVFMLEYKKGGINYV